MPIYYYIILSNIIARYVFC